MPLIVTSHNVRCSQRTSAEPAVVRRVSYNQNYCFCVRAFGFSFGMSGTPSPTTVFSQHCRGDHCVAREISASFNGRAMPAPTIKTQYRYVIASKAKQSTAVPADVIRGNGYLTSVSVHVQSDYLRFFVTNFNQTWIAAVVTLPRNDNNLRLTNISPNCNLSLRFKISNVWQGSQIKIVLWTVFIVCDNSDNGSCQFPKIYSCLPKR